MRENVDTKVALRIQAIVKKSVHEIVQANVCMKLQCLLNLFKRQIGYFDRNETKK